MIGIQNIGTYLPEQRRSNFDLKEKFDLDDHFIQNKIGFTSVALKTVDEDTSDLCVAAFRDLETKSNVNLLEIAALVVITQNPDYNLPHTAAIVHQKLGLPESCACFDVSLGCSGFVYGLSILESLMERNGMQQALLFTADPYSKIIDQEDKNTSLLFGDGAAVTLITNEPVWTAGAYTFGTIGEKHENLICLDDRLSMNGRAIFEFAARYVPKDVKQLLDKNGISSTEEIDLFALHQGSKYILDTLVKRLKIPADKAPFHASSYGNTVSSSIPFILADYLGEAAVKNILISGFGVGLSWSSTILRRT